MCQLDGGRFRSLMSVCTSLDTHSRHYPSRVCRRAINTALHTVPVVGTRSSAGGGPSSSLSTSSLARRVLPSIVSTPGGRDGVATWPEERIEEGRRETPVFSDISVKRDDKGSREKHASRGTLRIMFSDVPQKGIGGR